MGFLKSKAVVLKYSNISYDKKKNFLDEWVYHKSFEEQLDYLSKNNIPIIPLDDTVAYMRGEFKSAFEKKLGKKIVYYSVNDDVPKEPMISLLKREGFQAAFCQSPTEQKTHPYAIGRILIDDNDLNILLIKISRAYIFFKDSRYWTYFRQYKLGSSFRFATFRMTFQHAILREERPKDLNFEFPIHFKLVCK